MPTMMNGFNSMHCFKDGSSLRFRRLADQTSPSLYTSPIQPRTSSFFQIADIAVGIREDNQRCDLLLRSLPIPIRQPVKRGRPPGREIAGTILRETTSSN
ncbi:unnamed protein product [Cuscuta campestris]|uniref:Uncharacterized protein n=1 Tax=Cuscuta campestris TaxID=132261 RepID=A0A484KQL6_9ASTE|nr:unnamed protein product [Cuscuta campestris]